MQQVGPQGRFTLKRFISVITCTEKPLYVPQLWRINNEKWVVGVPDLFDLQPVAPDPLQEVTEARNKSVLFNTGDADLSVAQLHGLPTHLLHQHTLGLQGETHALLLQRYLPHNIGFFNANFRQILIFIFRAVGKYLKLIRRFLLRC